jgi:hypothetical protein
MLKTSPEIAAPAPAPDPLQMASRLAPPQSLVPVFSPIFCSKLGLINEAEPLNTVSRDLDVFLPSLRDHIPAPIYPNSIRQRKGRSTEHC